MQAIQQGQITEASLSPEDRANIATSKAMLNDLANNEGRLQQQTANLENVLAEAQTTREQLLKERDRDTANGKIAAEALIAIHSVETAARLGKLFNVPVGAMFSASFDLAEGMNSAPEFLAKAQEQGAALKAEVQDRTAALFSSGGGDQAATGNLPARYENAAPGAMERARHGWDNIGKSSVETATFLPDRYTDVKDMAAVFRPSQGETGSGTFMTGIDRLEKTSSGIAAALGASDAVDAYRRGDMQGTKEKALEAGVNIVNAINSDAGKLANAVNNVRKDVATRQEMIELSHLDPMLAQNLRLQTKIMMARRLESFARRAAMLDLIQVSPGDVQGARPQ